MRAVGFEDTGGGDTAPRFQAQGVRARVVRVLLENRQQYGGRLPGKHTHREGG